MLRPVMSQIKREDQSNYSFVFAVAKRAEEIENDPDSSDYKPVDLAVNEFATGKVKMGRVVTIDEK